MGYRFSGQKLTLNQPLEILSRAVSAGTVQVPADGQPIVLMADSQTTGGYPQIAAVIQADLGRLAQNAFGSEIYFEQVNTQQALVELQKNQLYLENIRKKIDEIR